MNPSNKGILLLVFCCFILASCNTYQWERKRYYNEDRDKNWNQYQPTESGEDTQKAAERQPKKTSTAKPIPKKRSRKKRKRKKIRKLSDEEIRQEYYRKED